MNEQVKTTLPGIKDVPLAAQSEMSRLFHEAQDAYNEYLTRKETAVEFIRATRRELGIQDNELWDISNDGTQFIKVAELPEDLVEVVKAETPVPQVPGA
jgi:hypothetical protein